MLLASIIGILFGSIFILLYTVTIIGLILVIIAENRNPLKTIPWVVVLLLAPGVGLIFYFFFGQDNRKQRIIKRRTYKRLVSHPKTGKIPADACHVPEPYRELSILLNRTRNAPLRYGSQIEVYTNGRDKFEALFQDIQQAKHHIHIQYYIFADDKTGRTLRELLVQKAREGVRVRVLYDDVGCWNVPNRFFREMKQQGIEVYPFLRVAFPTLTSKVNYRNHRKIVVIDGRIGYMGGMNVADRYIEGVSWGAWRDLHFRITGKGVYETPYFLPTEGLNQALQIAARGGIDVRLMIPQHSDTRMAHLATRSFLAEMIRAGVKVYFYQAGFLHSKLILSDDMVSCIGSANMDFRSLEHNFEVNAFVYQREFALQMKKIFLHDTENSQRILPALWLKRPLRKRFSESFMRLFSPLL